MKLPDFFLNLPKVYEYFEIWESFLTFSKNRHKNEIVNFFDEILKIKYIVEFR